MKLRLTKIDEGLKKLQRTLSAEAVLVMKLLRALSALRAKPAVAKAMAGEGGERGIRTPGSVTFNSFQDCRNRPLCHFSGDKSIIFSY